MRVLVVCLLLLMSDSLGAEGASGREVINIDGDWAGPESAAILAHSVGGRPQNSEVDVGLVYADYYYVEALLRLKGL